MFKGFISQFLFITFLHFSLIVTGQYENAKFDRITIMDGLSQSSVYSILQDKKGFIWFGTRDGLNKFDGYSFKVYKNTPDDPFSISNNEVICLSQDNSGLLWIGTRGGGLNIFDSNKEKFFRYPSKPNDASGLGSDVVSSIFRDSKGDMWIGTMNGFYKAIKNFSNNTGANFSFIIVSKDVKPVSSSTFAVKNIEESKKGNLLVASENGFYIFNPHSYRFKIIDIPNSSDYLFTSSYQQSDSVFWMGSFENGMFKVIFEKDEDGKVKKIIRFDQAQGGIYKFSNRVDALLHDQFNNLWIASRGGLIKIDLTKNIKTTFINDPQDANSISDDRLNSLFVDRTGVLWIGTESQGINKYDLYKKQLFHYTSIPGNTNSLNNNFVTAIHSSQPNVVYIGTDGGGIDKIVFSNEHPLRFTHFKSNPNNSNGLKVDNIMSLLQDREGTLWIGFSANMFGRLDKGQSDFSYYQLRGYIFALMEDREGNIWSGNWYYGLYCFNKHNGTFKNYHHIDSNPHSLSLDMVLSIFQDKDGTIWVGTKGGGLNKLTDSHTDTKEAHFLIYKNEPGNTSSLSHNDVYCIYQDKSGTIWLGTAGGLNKVIYVIRNNEPSIIFKSYLERNGLPNEVIYGILEDKHGNLWMSTNNGISKFNPRSEKFVNFDINDGLQANEFNHNAAYIDTKGKMYFGGINGFNAFYPDSIKENPFSPQVVLTNIKIMGTNVEIGEKVNGRMILKNSIAETNEVILNYLDKEITIDFAAMHFSVPKKNKYQYRLTGFNDKWQEVSSQTRSVTYTNLDFGKYIFQVKASNNDGKWNDKPATLKIEVLAPPWKTIWAYLFYLLIIVSLLLIFRRYTLIGIKEKNKLQIEHFERNKFEELSKLKIQFFTNISHELRTPLTLIYSPLEDLLNYKKIDGYIHQHLSLMHLNVKRLLQMINQLLDFRKIDAGQLKLSITEIDIIDLLNDIYMSFKQNAMTRNIDFHFIHNDNRIFLWLDKDKITTVFYNILSNAFKFSPDNSSVNIEVGFKKESRHESKNRKYTALNGNLASLNFLEIKIIDTGIGIDEIHLNKIFERFYQAPESERLKFEGSGIGLAIAREYIEMHGGNIEVESVTGKGSCFIVNLPLGKKHFNPEYLIIQKPGIAKVIENNQKGFEYKIDGINELLTDKLDKKINAVEINVPQILIIEDNQEMLAYLNDKLSLKYKIFQSNNGIKGLESAIDNNPELIITDLMMPEMDGLELCKRIKSDLRTSHIPIIILTAKSTEESTIQGLETGADVYLSKPFNINILTAQIKALLDSQLKLKQNFSRQLILQPKDVTFTSIDERFLKKLMDILEQNITDLNFGIKELTLLMGMSHSVIFRKIKALTGLNVVEFIRSVRLKKAALILKKNKLPIAEVSYMVGFSDPKYFSKCFIKEFGLTPTEYSNRQEA